MKLSSVITTISTALLVALGTTASAATYDLVKASISLPGYVEALDGAANNILIKRTLTTNAVINLALGNKTKTKVPKNIVLVGAAEAGNLQAGTTTAARLLVVDIANPAAPVVKAIILQPDTTSPPTPINFAENHISNAFLRVGVGRAKVLAAGSISAGGNNSVNVAGTLKRRPTPSGPLPTIANTFTGEFTFKDDDGATKTAIVLAGKFTCSGKILGSVTF